MCRTVSLRALLAIVFTGLILAAVSPAWAEPYFNGSQSPDLGWGNPLNWTPNGVPAGNAVVDSGRTATMSSGVFGQTGWAIVGGANSWGNPGGAGTVQQSGGSLYLGDCLYLGLSSGVQQGTYNLFGTGSINTNLVSIGQSNGTGQFALSANGLLNARNWVTVGRYAGGSGTLTQTGGRIQTNGDYLAGWDGGIGTATQLGGSLYVGSWLYAGINGGGFGSYALSGTGTINAGVLHIGQSATGQFTQSGDTFLNVRGETNVGRYTGGNGTLTQTSGRLWSAGDYGVGWDNNATGAVTQSGGDTTVGGALYVGVNSTGTGAYALSGAGTMNTLWLRVGQSGIGTFTQSGTSRINVRRWDGESATLGGWGGTATYTMSDSALLEANQVNVGRYTGGSTGTFTLNNNASVILSDWMLIGRAGGTGTLNVHDGASLHAAWIAAGYESGGNGTINQDGGHIHTNGDYQVGNTGSIGVVTQSAGSVYLGEYLYVGVNGGGQGTYNLSGAGTINANALRIGQSTGALASQFTQSGNSQVTVRPWSGEATMVGYSGTGTYTLSQNASFAGAYASVGANGGSTGTLNINDNANFAIAGWMMVGRDGGTGTLNLNGGTLNLNSTGTNSDSRLLLGWGGGTGNVHLNGGNLLTSEIVTSGGTGNLYWNGGKITVQTNNWGNALMYNIASAYVQAGGAVIDTNGINTRISQALIEDSGSTGGGLTKHGAGTLALSGANTYTGNTTVNAGMLQATLPASLGANYAVAGNVVVNSGATLAVNTEGTAGLLGQFYSGHDHGVYTQTPPTWFAAKGVPGATQTTNAWGAGLDSGGNCANFPAGYAGNGGQFTVGWVGKFNATAAGTYQFATASDDGSALWVDGSMVVDNIYEQGVTERSGTVYLSAGSHDMWLGFDQSGGGLGFYSRYIPPSGGGWQVIPNSLLSSTLSGWTSANIDSLLGAATFNPGSTFAIDTTNGDFTYASNITLGNVGLRKLGASTLTLSGANTYSGGTTISGGSLGVSASANLGASSSPLNFLGGTLRVTGTTLTTVDSHPMNTLTFNGGFDIADAANTFTVSQSLTPGSNGSLSKLGAGTLALTGTNSFSAATVSGGTLRLAGTGSLASIGDMHVGNGSGQTAALNIQDSALLRAYGTLFVGRNGATGSVTQTGGRIQTDGAYGIGWDNGNGTGTQSAGSVYVGNAFYVGVNTTGTGAYTLSGTGTIDTNYFRIGQNGTGTFTQSGNSSVNARLRYVDDSENVGGWGGTGTYTLSENASYSGCELNVGRYGGSTGTMTINDNASVSLVSWIIFGRNSGTGTLNMNGGTLNLNSTGANVNSRMHLGWDGGTGNVHLNGGNLLTSEIATNSGTGNLYWNGGKITVQTNLWGNALMYNLATAYVQAGGAIIDTNGIATRITQALTEDPGFTGGGLTKYGAGVLTLSAANTYSGPTTVNGGTLRLDFSVAGVPSILNPASALTLSGGGGLNLVGQSGGTNSQTFNGLTINAGGSAFAATQNGAASLGATLGAITRNAGGTVDFTLPATGSFLTPTGTASTILTDAAGVAYATVGGTDWAAKDASNTQIVGLSTIPGGYTPSTANSLAGNADVASGVDTTLAGNTTITSLRQNVNEGRTINLNGNTLTTGGILIGSGVGAGGSSLTGGTLRGPAGGDLTVFQNSSQQYSISATIADNTSPTRLVRSGTGELILSGANIYSGGTTLNAGRTQALVANAFGTGTVTVNDSGQAWLLSNVTYANNFQITGLGWSEGAGQLGAIRFSSGAVLAGDVTLTGNSRITAWGSDTGTISGAISGPYGLQKTGTGTITLSGGSPNTFTGGMTMLNNGVVVLDKASGNAIGGNLVYGNADSPFVKWNRDEQIADTGIINYGTAAGHMHLELLGHTETVAGINSTTGYGVIENRQAEAGINTSGTMIVNNSADYSFNGYVRDNSGGSGTGVINFIKNGSGMQTLAGGNIYYTGATTVNGGTLRLWDTTSFNSDVTVNSGALELYGSGSWTLNKTISGPGGRLVKSGGGIVTLGATNTYGGGTTLTAGELGISGNAQIGGPSTPITFNGGLLRVLGTTLTNLDSHTVNWNTFNGGFDIADAGNTFTVTQNMGVLGISGLTKLGPGTLALTGSGNFASINLTGGTTALSGTGSLTANGEINIGRYGGNAAVVNVQDSASLRSTGSIIAIGREGGTGTLNVTTGTVNSQGWLGVGMWGGAVGTVNQSGGTVSTNSDTVYIGYSNSRGTYNLSNGLLKSPRVMLGQEGGSIATMNQTGGRIEAGGDYWVGYNGATGTATQSAGSVYAGSVLCVGINGGGSGSYALWGAGTISADQFRVGQSASGQFTQSGTSRVTVRNTGSEDGTAIGYQNTGIYTISENASFQGYLVNVGYVLGGVGGNGTLNVQGNASFTALSRLAVGRGAGTTGALTQTGGEIQSNGDYIVGWQAGTGTATQTAGSAYVGGVLYVGLDTGSNGAYSLSGNGTINTGYVRVGQNGTGTFTQSGSSQIHSRTWAENSTTIGGWSGGTGTYTIAENASFQGNQMEVGRYSGGRGTLNVNDNARVSLDDYLAIGRNTGIGYMNVTGGSVTAQAWVGVGMWDGAVGTAVQTGGLVSSITDTVYVGYSGSTGTYNMSGGRIISPNLSVGRQGGTGYMTVSGSAAVTIGSAVQIGRDAGSVGTLTMTGGSIETGGDFGVGWDGSGTGSVTQSAGSVYVGGPLYVGVNTTGTGTYTLSGSGTIDTNYFRIGQNARGTFTQSGTSRVNARLWNDEAAVVGGWAGTGTYTISENASFTGSELTVGRYSGSTGTMTINDNAKVSLTDWIIIGRNGATGTLNMNGGELNLEPSLALNGRMHIGWDGGTGTVHLNGGVIAASQVPNGGTANLYWNGGTFRVMPMPSAWGPFMYNLNNAYVQAGGAKIDTNGIATTIAQALIQDPASPGGGLTKSGAGTLTLASAATYTGATTVSGGTLRPAVGTGSTLWLDAANPDSIVQSGGKVTQWNDASGNGKYASQGTVSAQGTWHTDPAFVGAPKSVVDFGAPSSGQWMQLNTNITDIRSVFWVMKGASFLLGSTGTYDFHRGPAGYGSAVNDNIWTDNDWTSGNIRGGQTYLNGVLVNGQTTALPTAYSLVDVITTGNVQSNALAYDRGIGARTGGQQIGEIIVFNTALSDTQRQQVEAYLNYKWFGLGAGVGNLLPAGTPVIISGGGTLDLSGENYQTIGSLTSSDGLGSKVVLGPAALTLNGSNTAAFDGVISGTGTLTRSGSGIQTLTGASTYSGGTFVTGGTLLASNTGGSATGSGLVLVNSTGTLGGTGSVGGPVTVSGTGTVAPGASGASVGRLTLNDNFTMLGGSLEIELDGTAGAGLPGGNDVLGVYGLINLSGGTLDLLLHVNPGEGNKFLIVDNLDGIRPVQSPFPGLAEGAWLTSPYDGRDYRFQITYLGGTGNDVVLTAEVPEPATMILLGLAVTGLGGYIRRRRTASR